MAETQSGPLTNIISMQGFIPYKASLLVIVAATSSALIALQLFASEEEQQAIISSVEASLPGLTAFQRRQYDCVLEHLKDAHSANLQLVLIPATPNTEDGIEDQSRFFVGPSTPEARHQVTMVPCLQYPLARGTVHIRSNDPTKPPAIDPGFLSHPADADVLAVGLRFADKAMGSRHIAGKTTRRMHPNPKLDLGDLSQARSAVHELATSEYHPCGSIAMGAAVDTQLKVLGANRLRVVDASVFPNNVSGNIVSSVYMVAEKAADLIKAEWDHGPLLKACKNGDDA